MKTHESQSMQQIWLKNLSGLTPILSHHHKTTHICLFCFYQFNINCFKIQISVINFKFIFKNVYMHHIILESNLKNFIYKKKFICLISKDWKNNHVYFKRIIETFIIYLLLLSKLHENNLWLKFKYVTCFRKEII